MSIKHYKVDIETTATIIWNHLICPYSGECQHFSWSARLDFKKTLSNYRVSVQERLDRLEKM